MEAGDAAEHSTRHCTALAHFLVPNVASSEVAKPWSRERGKAPVERVLILQTGPNNAQHIY